jgi:hypothetical protein
MKINFSIEYGFELKDCKLDTIICLFTKLLPMILADLFNTILLVFADDAMDQESKTFCCEKCGNTEEFSWKTRHGKPTVFQTIFGKINVDQLQVTCKKCQKRMFITRHLLGLNKRVVTSSRTKRMLALIGALTPYRVAEKITGMFGIKLGRMAIWRCVQKEGSKIEFGLDSEELPAGEADGTGVPTIGVKKRGRELKVFVQKKKGGGIRVAGLSIGNYDSGWDKLFKPLLKQFEDFKQFLLVTDGDTNILKGLGGKVKIIFQRCLWHIPHQLKYCLWQDNVKHKSTEWLNVISEAVQICTVKHGHECEDVLAKIINDKKLQLQNLIDFCIKNEYSKCARYLKNAAPDMFSSIEEKLNGKTTSLVERVMKTVNFRINVGKWSEKGALNVNKIRLGYYYNDYDVQPFDDTDIIIEDMSNTMRKPRSRKTKRSDE